jgi:hypothetical protein
VHAAQNGSVQIGALHKFLVAFAMLIIFLTDCWSGV